MKSQCGEVALVCKPQHVTQVMDGRYDLAVLVSWKSGTVKRVVRSTLAAEGYAISEAGELTVWLTQCLTELHMPPGTDLKMIEQIASTHKTFVFTDSGSLSETVKKDAGMVADRRFRIVVAQLKQMFAKSGMSLVWCNSQQMLADGLTKVLTPCMALMALMAAKAYHVPPGRTKGPMRAALIVAQLGRAEAMVSGMDISNDNFLVFLGIVVFLLMIIVLLMLLVVVAGVMFNCQKNSQNPRVVINAECQTMMILTSEEESQTMMVATREGESQTAEKTESAPCGDVAGGLQRVEESQNAESRNAESHAGRSVSGDYWDIRESHSAEGCYDNTSISRGIRLRSGTVMCMHWRLDRRGEGKDFIMSCLHCMTVIARGEEGCKHLPLCRDGTNQFGPRIKCLQCRKLLLHNIRGSARYL